jgi:hypothetical protein
MRLRNFQQIQSHLQKKISKNINKKFNKITGLVEEVTEQLDLRQPKTVLNFALDMIKPYLQTLGLRISKLSEEQIEVVLPEKFKYMDINQELDEGAVCSAAVFSFRQLWNRNSPKGHFEIHIQKIHFERFRDLHSDLLLRLELGKLNREAIFADLSDTKRASTDMIVHIYDREEQLVGQVNILADLKLIEAIERK